MAKRELTRSVFELGSYNDDEVNDLPSETDPSHDEPIEKLLERMLRGEAVPTANVTYDSDESTGNAPSQGFDVPPQYRDGFDIADAAPIIEAAAAQLEPKAPPAPAPAPAPAAIPPDLEGKPN